MAPPTAPTTDGLLLVDKPAGVTSHDVVAAVRRGVRERRAGHAGTLDPFATGLLVVLLGRATRLLPHLAGEPKVYEAEIRFGAETDTEDLDGIVVREAPRPSLDVLRAAIPALTGAIRQIPPAYSAKRVDGRRAYERARAGEEVTLPAVPITVHAWELVGHDGPADAVETLRVRVTCGGGTYVRSLARDLARAAGSAAHLGALRRTQAGPFRVAEACTLADLRDGIATVRPPLDALPHLPREVVDAAGAARLARGMDVPATVAGDWAALVLDADGSLVALGERNGSGRWQPRVVLRVA